MMLEKKWWEKSVAYQIYPKSFFDSNNDGIGDICGIIEKLPYLNELGIKIIWISPVYKSPMKDNGYDISNYFEIDSQFGSLEDIKNLISQCNKYDIKVLMDLVVNHTSDKHEWFQEAVKNPLSKYRNYYYFKKGVNGKPPNNWRSIFGGSAWENIEGTNEYYLHLFYKEQPDLNWENEEVRKEVYNIIDFWMKLGIGGFRVDAITHIKKNFNKILPPDNEDGLCDVVNFARNAEGIEKFLSELKEKFDYYNAYTVGEAQGIDENRFSEYCGENGYFSEVFDFEAVEIDLPESCTWEYDNKWTVKEFRDILFKRQLKAQDGGMQALFLENHDEIRCLNRFIPKENINYYSTTMLALMYMMLRGTPYIYQGQEIGMTNCNFDDISQCRDETTYTNYQILLKKGIDKKTAMERVNQRCRDTIRTPIHWSDNKNAGFTNGEPWIKLCENYKEINIKKQIEDKKSVFKWYQKLIELRTKSKYSDILCKGNFKPNICDNSNIISYFREYEIKKLLIVCNFSSNISEFEINENYKVEINNYDILNKYENGYLLNPYQCLIISI